MPNSGEKEMVCNHCGYDGAGLLAELEECNAISKHELEIVRAQNERMRKALRSWLEFYTSDQCLEPHRKDERQDYVRLGERAYNAAISCLSEEEKK